MKKKFTKFLADYGTYALVSGASGGLGKEFAIALAHRGVVPILTARREERLRELAAYLHAQFAIEAPVCAADLSKEGDMEKLYKFCRNFDVGLLLLNAGFGLVGNFGELAFEQQKSMLHVNCLAPMLLSHRFFPLLKKRKKSAMIFLSSVVAHDSSPYLSLYSATKAFNLFLAQGLYSEWKRYGIDVLAVSPGPVATEFFLVAADGKGMGGVNPSKVAEKSLKAVGKKVELLPGLLAKTLVYGRKLLPQKLSLFITAQVMRIRTQIK